jgi:sugar lactone lactonase YvrE
MNHNNLMTMSNLRKWFVRAALMILMIPVPSEAQILLNNPESVVFDSLRNRYIVSNWGNGAIVQIDSLGEQSYYSTDLQGEYGLAGLYIYGDTLLVAAGNAPNAGIVGFNLETAEQLFHIVIPEVGLPNDITSDSEGIIYVSDYWGSQLYRIENHIPSLYFDQGLGWPNGMIYDPLHDRLLILSVVAPGAPILAVDIEDSTLSTVITTGLSGTDGITMDHDGRVYVSEWTGDTVRRYDSTFSTPPETFSTGHRDPADIYYDWSNRLLVVPNFGSNSLDFLPVEPLGIDGSAVTRAGNLPMNTGLHQNCPNPFNPRTVIHYALKDPGIVHLGIYNLKGQLLRELVNGSRAAGNHAVAWDGRNMTGEPVSSGIYFYRLRSGTAIHTRKMVLLK